MYFLSSLLFCMLITNALGNVTIADEDYKILTQSLRGPCACFNFTISEDIKCDDKRKEVIMSIPDLEKLCETFLIPNRTSVAKTSNKIIVSAKTIEYMSCRCVYFTVNATITLNCTLSNKMLGFNPPPKTREMFNSLCQNLTWSDLPIQNITEGNNTNIDNSKNIMDAVPILLCTKDKKYCSSQQNLDEVVISTNKICACSNFTIRENKTECAYKEIWPTMDKNFLADIGNACQSIINLDEVLQNITKIEAITETTPYDNNETISHQNKTTTQIIPNHNETTTQTIPNHNEITTETIPKYNETTTIPNYNETTVYNNDTATTSPSQGITEAYVAPPPTETESGRYSMGTIAGVGCSAFVIGVLIAVAAKMTYTRYRRRTYAVNPVQP